MLKYEIVGEVAESCLPAGRGRKRQNMFFVYILKSVKDNNLYIGKTNNLKRRIFEHNNNYVQSTKSRAPFILLEFFECLNEKEAVKIEKEYKKGYRREEIKRKFNIV